jgi:hypothetical protein
LSYTLTENSSATRTKFAWPLPSDALGAYGNPIQLCDDSDDDDRTSLLLVTERSPLNLDGEADRPSHRTGTILEPRTGHECVEPSERESNFRVTSEPAAHAGAEVIRQSSLTQNIPALCSNEHKVVVLKLHPNALAFLEHNKSRKRSKLVVLKVAPRNLEILKGRTISTRPSSKRKKPVSILRACKRTKTHISTPRETLSISNHGVLHKKLARRLEEKVVPLEEVETIVAGQYNVTRACLVDFFNKQRCFFRFPEGFGHCPHASK